MIQRKRNIFQIRNRPKFLRVKRKTEIFHKSTKSEKFTEIFVDETVEGGNVEVSNSSSK